jgi:hypothetical protein
MEDKEEQGLGLGGVLMISGTLNDYYRHKRADGWKKHATDQIKDKYNDYLVVMKYFNDFVYKNDSLNKLLPSPILAQGWYGRVNQKVHKDLYGYAANWDVKWSNKDVLEYLEKQHKIN